MRKAVYVCAVLAVAVTPVTARYYDYEPDDRYEDRCSEQEMGAVSEKLAEALKCVEDASNLDDAHTCIDGL